ncbi:hypothetical protein GCM10010172_57770 [Paractinoplanes ferrugineus]|uniref:Uncharacterized protein n=1 Tax=Paractinoplanes ferrugineus TaxID=113564 RepID=A0A919MIE0_9ACTN|nr:hypothetical protein [Actinoplanes ferrugineus]GIE15919.1 hypothetical protein Afe05nite_77590 [Actinoplanes ferrugineus]
MTLPAPRPAQSTESPPYEPDPWSATRHLCAAAYLDDGFREIALSEVYYQPRRMVAPSYGFDLIPVLGHCLRARNAAIFRDAAIVATFVVVLCASWATLLGVLAVLIALQVVVETRGLARDVFDRLRGGTAADLGTLGTRAAVVGLGWVFVFLLLVFSTGVLADPTAALLGNEFGEPSEAPSSSLTGAVLVAGVLLAFPFSFSLWRQNELSGLTPGNRVTTPVTTPRLEQIGLHQRGNTVVYAGFRPFVGAGALVDSWGFAQRLIRAEPPAEESLNGLGAARPRAATERDREFAEPPFSAAEVIDHVRQDMARLLPRRAAEEQIAGLGVDDRVFVAGTEVSHLTSETDDETIARIIRHPTTPARHQLVCQVFAWGGELITTVYVHIAVQGRSLYLELSTTALPPCADRYRIVDTIEGSGAGASWRAARAGLFGAPGTIWRAPLALSRAVLSLFRTSVGPISSVRLPKGYDYGARLGIRELGSETRVRNFVQLQDVEKYQRLIERRVIASVLDFLDLKGVDTTEYRARAASVLQVNTVNNVNGHFANIGGRSQFAAPVEVRGSGGTS